MPPPGGIFIVRTDYLFSLLSLVLSHCWFAMPQLVLQADWQEVWHSPQPPFFALSHRLRVSMVLICFMMGLPPLKILLCIIAQTGLFVKMFSEKTYITHSMKPVIDNYCLTFAGGKRHRKLHERTGMPVWQFLRGKLFCYAQKRIDISEKICYNRRCKDGSVPLHRAFL